MNDRLEGHASVGTGMIVVVLHCVHTNANLMSETYDVNGEQTRNGEVRSAFFHLSWALFAYLPMASPTSFLELLPQHTSTGALCAPGRYVCHSVSTLGRNGHKSDRAIGSGPPSWNGRAWSKKERYTCVVLVGPHSCCLVALSAGATSFTSFTMPITVG